MYPKTRRLLGYLLLIYILDEVMDDLEFFFFHNGIWPFLLLGGIYFAVQAGKEETRFKVLAYIMGIGGIAALLKAVVPAAGNAAKLMEVLNEFLFVGTMGWTFFSTARPLEACRETGYAAYAHLLCAFVFLYDVFLFLAYAAWLMPGQGILYSVMNNFLASYIQLILLVLLFLFLWKSRKLLKRAADTREDAGPLTPTAADSQNGRGRTSSLV